jgi:hypothetical protein
MEDLVHQENFLVENNLERLHACLLERWMKLGPMLRDHVGNPPRHMLFVEHQGHEDACLQVHSTIVSSVHYVL